MQEVKGKYNTAKVFTDVIERNARRSSNGLQNNGRYCKQY